jgi:hypothetical protein
VDEHVETQIVVAGGQTMVLADDHGRLSEAASAMLRADLTG